VPFVHHRSSRMDHRFGRDRAIREILAILLTSSSLCWIHRERFDHSTASRYIRLRSSAVCPSLSVYLCPPRVDSSLIHLIPNIADAFSFVRWNEALSCTVIDSSRSSHGTFADSAYRELTRTLDKRRSDCGDSQRRWKGTNEFSRSTRGLAKFSIRVSKPTLTLLHARGKEIHAVIHDVTLVTFSTQIQQQRNSTVIHCCAFTVSRRRYIVCTALRSSGKFD